MGGRRYQWLGWFFGFLLVALGWAVLTPVNQYPDEIDHVYRAVSLVRGAVTPHNVTYDHGTGALVEVPRSVQAVFLSDSPCLGYATETRCEDNTGEQITALTSEGRMFPLYYAVVGWPSLLFPDQTGLLLMRVFNGLITAALLATAATVLTSITTRPAVTVAGLFAALTPLVLYLAGSTNPSAIETASAVSFWAAALALAHSSGIRNRDRLLRYASVSAVVLATSRMLGLLWIVLALGLSLATADPRTRRPLLREMARTVLTPAIIAACAMCAWTVVFRSYETYASLTPIDLDLGEILVASAANTGTLLKQTLAYFGWLTIPPPQLTIVCWILIIAGLLFVAVHSDRRARMATLTAAALVLLMPFAFQVLTFPRAGLGGWQGRYTLPLAVGVPLLAVVTAGRNPTRTVTTTARTILVLCLVGHVAAIVTAASAFGSTATVPSLVTGLVLLTAGGALLTTAVIWADRSVSNGHLGHSMKPANIVAVSRQRTEVRTATDDAATGPDRTAGG